MWLSQFSQYFQSKYSKNLWLSQKNKKTQFWGTLGDTGRSAPRVSQNWVFWFVWDSHRFLHISLGFFGFSKKIKCFSLVSLEKQMFLLVLVVRSPFGYKNFHRYWIKPQQWDLNPKYKSRPQQEHLNPGPSLFKKWRGPRPLLRNTVQSPNNET